MNNRSKDNYKDKKEKNKDELYDPNSMGYESAEVGHLMIDPANYHEVKPKSKDVK